MRNKMKEDLLKKIARKGYNIAYAANLNFATYDIVKKIPNIIAFLTIVVGILGLGWPNFMSNKISTVILILGILSVYIEKFNHDIEAYANRGKKNIQQLNQLKNLYLKVKNMSEISDFQIIESEYASIENEFNENSEPNQILFSSWFAHYKIFYQKDISWIDKQLNFSFWKDKIPESAKFCLYGLIGAIIVYYCVVVPELNDFFRTVLYINKQ